MHKTPFLFLMAILFISSCSQKRNTPTQSRYSIKQDSAPALNNFSQPNQWNIKPEPKSKYGNKSSYQVFGKTYYVLASNDNFEQTGTASWYGKKFHGHTTSNMEIFDMYKYTAAHRTLPLPSFIEVTNLDNNKKIIVRVNDRGPFKSKRIIDLSWAAAKALGYDKKGLANVHLKLVTNNNNHNHNNEIAANDEPIQGLKYLQVGAYSQKDNALDVAKRISKAVVLPVHVNNNSKNDGLYRVRIGPLTQDLNIIDIIQKVNFIGFNNTKMVVE